MNSGKLIILNGASSCGKTSTCRAMQDMLAEEYVLLGLDVFSQIIPPKQNNMATIEPEYFTAKPYVKNGLTYYHIQTGPKLDAIIYTSYKAIATYLDAGINVISDQLFWNPSWFRKALDTFINYPVFFVGIHITDEEGSARERKRGTGDANDILEDSRLGGWSRTSAAMTHQNMIYDFEIDNTNLSIQKSAELIKQAYETAINPRAFKTLYQTYHAVLLK